MISDAIMGRSLINQSREGGENDMAKEEKKKAEPKVKYLTSKDVAAVHKVKPSFLRRVLRSLPKYQDGGYTRYKWEEGDTFLATLGKTIEAFRVKEKDRNAKRLAALKDKQAKGKGKKTAKAAPVSEEGAEEIV